MSLRDSCWVRGAQGGGAACDVSTIVAGSLARPRVGVEGSGRQMLPAPGPA